MNNTKVFLLVLGLLMVLVGTAVNNSLALSGAWETKASMSTLRWGAASGVIGSQFYAVGGDETGVGRSTTMEAYNPTTDSWSTKAPLPGPRFAPVAGVIGGKLYVTSGEDASGAPSNTLEIYDPSTDSWTSGAPLPTTRYRACGTVLNGKLYVVGGYASGGNMQLLEVYDPATNTWSTKTPMPTGRFSAATAALGGMLYVAGGELGGGAPTTGTVEAYDPVTDIWSTKSSMPTPRDELTNASGVINGLWYVAGGRLGPSGPATDTLEAYDPATDTWASQPSMPTAREQASAAVFNSLLYVAAGRTPSGELISTLEAFTPSSETPPQLTDLGSAKVWLGLRNSDDVGTKFDLLAEVFKNGSPIGSGQTNGVPGGSSGFNNAVARVIDLALTSPVDCAPGDTLSIKLSVRIAVGVTGHRSGTARLWFNDAAADTHFGATIGGATESYYLRSGSLLSVTPGPGPKNTIDVLVDRAVGGNPFKPFGTWTITF